MKVVGTIIIVFSTLCGYAQHQILNKEWIIKRVSHDTLLLSIKPADEMMTYLERPCEFQDTSYHWTLSQNGVIKINRIIRSCSKGRNKYPTQKDSSKISLEERPHKVSETLQLRSTQKHDSSNASLTVLTHYQSLDIKPPEEIRMSLWDETKGIFHLKKEQLIITNGGKFDGTYRIEILDSRSIKLISNS